jgi:hypothetical protein
MGIQGGLLDWFQSYLSDRKQTVVLRGVQSEVRSLTCGVPQGSVLGPLLFIVYINDLVEDIECDSFLFADDASILRRLHGDSIAATTSINRDLVIIDNWCKKWLFKINVAKTKGMLFSRKRQPSPELPLYLNNVVIQNVSSHKQLGMVLSSTLDWTEHISEICTKSLQRIHAWKSMQYKLSRKNLENCMNLFVLPILDYGDILYDSCSEADKVKLDSVQLAAGLSLVLNVEHLTNFCILRWVGALCGSDAKLIKFARYMTLLIITLLNISDQSCPETLIQPHIGQGGQPIAILYHTAVEQNFFGNLSSRPALIY